MVGELRCRDGILMLESGQRGVVGGGGKRQRRGGDRPARDGDEIGDRWGPHVNEGEREGAMDGRHNPKKKTHSAKYAKGARRPDGPSREVAACGVMGQRGQTGLAWPDPRRNSKEKMILNFYDFLNLAGL
jgi:hypothetical protein